MTFRIDYLIPTYNAFLNNTFKRLNYKRRSLNAWLRNIKEVSEYIETKDNPKTRNTYYCALKSFLDYHKKKILSSKIALEIKKLSQEIQQKLGDQELLKGRKHFTTYELNKLLDDLKIIYEKDKTNNRANLAHLALALYVRQPPNRNIYSKMLFKRSTSCSNWVDLENKQIVINRDKISKHIGGARITLTPEIYDIIIDSLESYPREYILAKHNNPDKPLEYKALYNILKKIDKQLNIDSLRSSYITEFYKTNPTINQKNELATIMRHNRATQETFYNKTPSTEINFNE